MDEAAKTPGGRALSALEFALAAGVVLGHNVWRVLPNEVPILVMTASRTVAASTGPSTLPDPCDAKYSASPRPTKANAGPANRR